jgi:hypothetical protein
MRSPKKIYSTFLCLIVLSFGLFTSCKDNDDENDTKSEQPLTISAAVENGNSYNSKIDSVKVEAYSETAQNELIIASTPYLNGGFNMTLPYPLDEKYLSNNILAEDEIPSGMVVSDKTARATIADFYGYKSGDKMADANFIYGGYVTNLSSSSLKIEVTQVSIVYCDKPAKLSGSFTQDLDGVSVAFTINLSWSKGWNIFYNIEKSTVNLLTGEQSGSVNVTQSKPSYGLKWYCGDDFQEALYSDLGISSLASSMNKMKPAFFQLKK